MCGYRGRGDVPVQEHVPVKQCGQLGEHGAGYLSMAEMRTESIYTVEVADLENISTPQMIMLAAVSGAGAQDSFHVQGAVRTANAWSC